MDTEKSANSSLEHVECIPDEVGPATNRNGFSAKEQKRVMRRVDNRVVIILACIYCVSLIDRVNLGLAAVAGLRADLVLTGNRYSIIALIFFPTYVLFQPVATVLIRKTGPRRFLSFICLAWSATMIGFGFVNDWIQLVPLRLVLGILEAGSFPGGIYLLSCWFTRSEMQRRNTYYYMIGMIASAFGGILAYGLTQMEGAASIRGWRWIFIMEGSITCAVAVAAYFVIVDFPDKATESFRFLDKKEADFVIARIELDRKDVNPETFYLRKYLGNALDIKVWAYALMFALAAIPTYGLAYFLPIILQEGLGFGQAKAQCLTAPPQASSVIVMYIQAQLGDKYQLRGLWIAINAILILVGIPILGYVHDPAVRYFGVFLVAMGAYSQVPAILSYQASNIRGQWRRAFCSATLIGLSGVGAVAGTLIFRTQDAPHYYPGLIAIMTATGLVLLILAALTALLWHANKQVEHGRRVVEGLEGFKYTL